MEFSFQPLTRQEFPMIINWLAKPHVKKWWPEPEANLAAVEKEFGASIDGTEPTKVYLAIVEDKPIGIIQCYQLSDYPKYQKTIKLDNAVGVDLFIGEEAYVGKGYGTAMIKQFVEEIIRRQYPDAKYAISDPEVKNFASIRAFEKAGFIKGPIKPGDYGPEYLMTQKL